MAIDKLPLKEVSIEELYISGSPCTYEIPIYQRNYAWGKDEIAALIQDTYDAYLASKKDENKIYYIGTLVSFHKGEGVFEIIDGQQRLTTIRLILSALHIDVNNKLTYRARKKSEVTLKALPKAKEDEKVFLSGDFDEKDTGITEGYKFATAAVKEIVEEKEREKFTDFFKRKVHIIHYRVPKDIDLNHYFEIMNSRGEQLEKHEIIKAQLMQKLSNDREASVVFNEIWESCSEMSVYIQQSFKYDKTFATSLCKFEAQNFDALIQYAREANQENKEDNKITITNIPTF